MQYKKSLIYIYHIYVLLKCILTKGIFIRKSTIFACAILLSSLSASSQDTPLSQFYSNLVVLNPAFTGTTQSNRINTFYRNQWIATDAGFHSFGVAYDKSFSKYNSGLGIVFTNEINGLYVTPTIDVAYSYIIQFAPRFFISMGIQGGATQKYLSVNNLIFDSDEIINNGFSKVIPDFSSGFIVFYNNSYSGFSIDHIAQPYQGVSKSINERLNRKYTAFFGYMYYHQARLLSQQRVFSPNVLIQVQGYQHNINWGFSFQYDKLIGGVWARHNLQLNIDAIIFSAGIKTQTYKFTYSYDMNVGKRTVIPLGAHELSFTTMFDLASKKRYKSIKCPTFLQ